MLVSKFLLMACLALPAQVPQSEGVINGIVINASDSDAPLGEIDVFLRVKLDGQFIPVEKTTTDARGAFVFTRLPVGRDYQYRTGANRHGIHYPGPLVQLSSQRCYANVRLEVHDALTDSNPLVILRHEIIIHPKANALTVTESIMVDNPSSKSYVGQAATEGAEPVTLQLSIPSDFVRVTFNEEFFGRSFSLLDGKLVTGIPWPPGRRELKFTYVLPNTKSHRLWERPMDLPCSELHLCVRAANPNEVSCNLEPGPVRQSGELTELSFQSSGGTLPPGHVIRVQLGYFPVPWMTYGRYPAPLVLIGLIAAASLVIIRQRRCGERQTASNDSLAPPTSHAKAPGQQRTRGSRRQRKRRASARQSR